MNSDEFHNQIQSQIPTTSASVIANPKTRTFFNNYKGSLTSVPERENTDNIMMHFNLTTSTDLTGKLVNDPELVYVEYLPYGNDSVYRGQTTRIDGALVRHGYGV